MPSIVYTTASSEKANSPINVDQAVFITQISQVVVGPLADHQHQEEAAMPLVGHRRRAAVQPWEGHSQAVVNLEAGQLSVASLQVAVSPEAVPLLVGRQHLVGVMPSVDHRQVAVRLAAKQLLVGCQHLVVALLILAHRWVLAHHPGPEQPQA